MKQRIIPTQRFLLAALLVGISLTPGFAQKTATGQKVLTLDDLFPTDRVLDVQITVAEEDWDELRNQSQTFFDVLHEGRKNEAPPSRYTYVPASITIDGVQFPNIGLRKKGFIGSQDKRRPSMKVKLNFVDKETHIEGLNNLTFNNNKQDVSLASQFVGYQLYDDVGLPASRCAYASITVNGKHLGVYSHVETARQTLARREFGNDSGTLYEGTVTDFHDEWENSFENKFGDDAAGRSKIRLLTAVLESDDDTDIEKRIGEHVDLDSFYKFWALESLIGFWDGYCGNRNNYFVYLNPVTDKFHFMPWGADAMFEKYSLVDRDPRQPVSVKTNGYVAYRLYQSDAGRERYRKTLMNLLENHWQEEKLLSELDRIERLLEPHLGASQGNHERNVDKVRTFIKTRRSEIMEEIATGMPEWRRRPQPPPAIPANADWRRGRRPSPKDMTIWDAAKTGNFSVLKKRMADGMEVDTPSPDGTTALAMAVLGGQNKMTEYLLEQGADVNTRNNDGNAPIHTATFLGRFDTTKILVENKADVNLRNGDGVTPLDIVKSELNEQSEGILDFLANFVQVRVSPEYVKAGRPKIEALLIEKNAKHSEQLPKDKAVKTGNLWMSAKQGDLAALKSQLAREGTDPDQHDDMGLTPLCWAAMANQPKAVEMLIKSGADVNARNRDQGTPLHSASFLGRYEVVELLIKNKADVNIRNGLGQTPLTGVTVAWGPEIEGITQFVSNFLKIDVDVDAIKAVRPRIAELLRKHGGE